MVFPFCKSQSPPSNVCLFVRVKVHRLMSGSNIICKSQRLPLTNIVLFRFFLSGPNILASTPPDVHPPQILSSLGFSFRDSTFSLAHHPMSTPLRVSTSSLAHCSMSGFDIICKSPSPPLTDIVLFGLFLPVLFGRTLVPLSNKYEISPYASFFHH